jgi:hypothetical protein
MQKNKNNAFNKAKWDPMHSTFAQKIHFKNGNELSGYSKRLGFSERQDKLALLCNMILRDYRYGYLDRFNNSRDPIDHIEMYHLAVDRQNPPRMVKLYYTFAEFEHGYIDHEKGQFNTWLTKFYKTIEDKRSIDDIWNACYFKPLKKSESDPLDLKTRRFSNLNHLNNYCLYLIENDIRSKGEVELFYKKYIEKWLK